MVRHLKLIEWSVRLPECVHTNSFLLLYKVEMGQITIKNAFSQ